MTGPSSALRGRSAVGSDARFGLSKAIRAASPVGNLRLIDLIAVIVVRREAGRFADRAVDVHHAPADSTNQMVMVVADAILEARG